MDQIFGYETIKIQIIEIRTIDIQGNLNCLELKSPNLKFSQIFFLILIVRI